MSHKEEYFFDESEDGYGRVFVPRGPWTRQYSELVQKNDIKVVRLSAAAGWSGDNISFLTELNHLHGVEIYSQNISTIADVTQLSNLRFIGLECDLKEPVNFAFTPKLEVFKATWKKSLLSILQCSNLKHLNLSNWPESDFDSLSNLQRLKKLLITSRKLSSLGGISRLNDLEHIDLHGCPKLSDLKGIDNCVGLRILSLSSCKALSNVSLVGKLSLLREFSVDDCGDLDSLATIRNCGELEKLSFLGTTSIKDGNLAFISSFKKLRILRFSPRRHYNAKRDDLLKKTKPD